MLGKTISHYKILEKLGEGGMGVVYKAQDTKLDRIVALKFLSKDLLRDEEAKTRFVHEAKAASALDHSNIATVYEIDEVESECFISMAYIQGKSIKELIKEKRLSIEEILKIAIQVCEGLTMAHEKGIVHRDIKSDNIMLTPQGQVKIMDFGLAKLKGATKLTTTGTTLGTLQYMSPEQAQGKEADHRSDIFSFGVVLYEMITGQLPFKGEHEAAIIYSIINETPEPLARYKANVPEGLQRIVDKVLQKDLGTRYQSAADIVADLKGLQKETTAGVVTKPFKRGIRVPSLGFVGIAVLVIIAVYALYSQFLAPTKKELIPERKILAVLPFENLGPAEHEYFADGITEEIRSRLSSVSGLAVISRMSTSRYKNSDKTIKEIGEELGVQYVLDGTIRWQETLDGERRVRIVPQLIKVADDVNLWSKAYDTVMIEIFTVQSDIAEKVSKEMGVVLLESEKKAVWEKWTDSEQAYDYYLRGWRYAWGLGQYDEKGLRLGLELFQKAAALDSDFTLAYTNMSAVYSGLYHYWHDRSDSCRALAKAMADKALELNPELRWAHHALGLYYYWCFRDYEKALQEYDIAWKGNKNNSDYLWYTLFLLRRQGKWEEAYARAKRVAELEPKWVLCKYELGSTCWHMRKYEEAEQLLDQVISLAPDFFYAYEKKAQLYVEWKGDTKKAREVIQQSVGKVDTTRWRFTDVWLDLLDGNYRQALGKVTIPPYDSAGYYFQRGQLYKLMGELELMQAYFDSSATALESLVQKDPEIARAYALLGVSYAGLGRKEEAIRAGKRAMEIMPLSKDAIIGYPLLDYVVQIYILVDELDMAMDQLELMLSVPGGFGLAEVLIDPDYAALRDHPRFKRLLEEGK